MKSWHFGLITGAAVLLIVSTVVGAVALINGQDTANKASDTATRLTKIVHTATCGGGHKEANFAACHRLCPNLATISDIHCDTKLPKGVVGSNGNSPSSQPGPSGGQRQPQTPPETPSAPPSAPEHTFVVPDPIKTVCGVTAPLTLPVCN